ncbi:hypothetical protein Sango_1909200 [Sesamum angolense]|uniref:CCHC-type domain-containing protein n=1 Tax=Sesamum angolense TaxID=2727404 RepID=A0AAE2BQU1_9LAMI|nr:hypothetical protein Sango_1909200 [Sesamum angolense]
MLFSVSSIKAKHWNKLIGAGPSNSQNQNKNLTPQGDKVMKRRREKQGRKKNMAKTKCYTCQKMSHFACECIKPKKVRPNTTSPSLLCAHMFLCLIISLTGLSTMGTEYVTCTLVVQEVIYLRRFPKSLCISMHINDVVVNYFDNTTTIAYAKDLKYHRRTKHVDTYITSSAIVLHKEKWFSGTFLPLI